MQHEASTKCDYLLTPKAALERQAEKQLTATKYYRAMSDRAEEMNIESTAIVYSYISGT